MNRTRRPVLLALAALLAIGTLAATACSGSSSSSSNVKKDGVIVKDAWARTSPMSSGMGAAYVTIENTTGVTEKLLSVDVPTSVARTAQIHETTSDGGMMSMKEVSSISIPAGGTVKLEPGGYHVMLLDLVEPLKSGQKFTMTLGLMNARVVQVEVTVKDS